MINKQNLFYVGCFVMTLGRGFWAHAAAEPFKPAAQAAQAVSESKIVLGKRPQTVQAAIDRVFQRVKDRVKDKWRFDGNLGYYRLFGLFEEKIIINILAKLNDDDIYLVDVGCSQGSWGKAAMHSILSNGTISKNTKKHFHIFSVTGGRECDECILTEGNVTLYQFTNFKIENLDEEFAKRGYDLKDKVHFAVASWTLPHLVDPWGTLKRMYGLLKPSKGLLVSNGFRFAINDSKGVQSFPGTIKPHAPALEIFIPASAIYLLRTWWDYDNTLEEFVLMRGNELELELPLEYTGETRILDGVGVQTNARYFGAVYKKREIQSIKPFFFKPADFRGEEDGLVAEKASHSCYCDQNSEASKKLYSYFKKQDLFRYTS